MKPQDIFNQIKKQAQEQEKSAFEYKEIIWSDIESRLDNQDNKRPVTPWILWGSAASIALIAAIAMWFLLQPDVVPNQEIPVATETAEPEITPHSQNDVITHNSDSMASQTDVLDELEKTSMAVEMAPENPSIPDSKFPNLPDNEFEQPNIISESVNPVAVQTEDTVIQPVLVENSLDSKVSGIKVSEMPELPENIMDDLESSAIAYQKVALPQTEQLKLNLTNSAKSSKVTGIIVDDFGPVLGALIMVNETGVSTEAGEDGSFFIDAQIGQSIFVLNPNTLAEKEFVISGLNMGQLIVTDQATALHDVVVLGYAHSRRKVREPSRSEMILDELKGQTAGVKVNSKEKLREMRKEERKFKRELRNLKDDEDYSSFNENPFTSPQYEPLSTFSVDVDNASYSNIRRFINNGADVPKDAVRIEEMINYFNYTYAQPKGNDPVGIQTEMSTAPWNSAHQLLKIGLKSREIPTNQIPASNFVFLIDVSGSMSDDNKLPLLKSSMKMLVDKLRADDKVSIVVYAGAAGTVLEPTPGNEKQKILQALENLEAGGSTAGGAGIELAYNLAQENFVKNGNNRIILATDGDFNVGESSDRAMEKLIEQKRKSGVFLTVLGFGMGNLKDAKMEILANKGNGNYAYIDNLQEANKYLVKEFGGTMFTVAKDVKIQIEFNPEHVQAYRLIGYENRRLRPEDFKNDAIDAGEMGSGHTVTALYEIIPTGAHSAYFESAETLKYSEKVAPKGIYKNELATVKFRYKQPDGDTSKEVSHVISKDIKPAAFSSPDFRFAAAVAWFGLKLRDSELIPNKNSEDIIKLAEEGRGEDKDGYRAEFIRLVDSVRD